MGNKNRTAPGQQVQIGRHQRTLPVASPAARLASQLETRERHSKRERELESQLAAEQAAHEATKYRNSIEETVILNKQAMGLDDLAFRSLDNTVENAVKEHLVAGKPLKAFPVFDVINGWKARHGKALPLPAKDASPLDAQLPPPRTETRVLPNDRAAHDAAMRPYQERSARARERDLRERERYDRRLREMGLQNPAIGSFPGGSSGMGS